MSDTPVPDELFDEAKGSRVLRVWAAVYRLQSPGGRTVTESCEVIGKVWQHTIDRANVRKALLWLRDEGMVIFVDGWRCTRWVVDEAGTFLVDVFSGQRYAVPETLRSKQPQRLIMGSKQPQGEVKTTPSPNGGVKTTPRNQAKNEGVGSKQPQSRPPHTPLSNSYYYNNNYTPSEDVDNASPDVEQYRGGLLERGVHEDLVSQLINECSADPARIGRQLHHFDLRVSDGQSLSGGWLVKAIRGDWKIPRKLLRSSNQPENSGQAGPAPRVRRPAEPDPGPTYRDAYRALNAELSLDELRELEERALGSLTEHELVVVRGKTAVGQTIIQSKMVELYAERQRQA